jgi:hypothetical protein
MSDWIKVKCIKCGTEGNYKRTLSGTAPCKDSRCFNLVKVGKMTEAEAEAYREELRVTNERMMARSND